MQIGWQLDIDYPTFCLLDKAVNAYLDFCRKQIAAGRTKPFTYDLRELEGFMSGLRGGQYIISQYIPGPKPPED